MKYFDFRVEYGLVIGLMANLSDTIFMYVMDNYQNHLVNQKYFTLSPGNTATVTFNKVVEKYLGEPHDHCTPMKDPSYRQINCLQNCTMEHVKNEYNCTLPGYYRRKDYNYCNLYGSRDIYDNFISEFSSSCLIMCKKECIVTRYNYAMVNSFDPYSIHYNENRGLINIHAYFDYISYTEISDSPKTTVASLVSSVGGSFGLFLGMSLLSVFEVVGFFMELVSIIFNKPTFFQNSE